MKNTRFLLCICMIAFAVSCKKEDDIVSTTSTFSTYSTIDDIYNLLEVKPKYVTVNGATGGTFYGTSGTKYVIPANCLQNASGTAVTGDVQVAAAEYLKKGDMIFSKMLPVSNGEPLLSGGEISIHATLSGQLISLKPGCSCAATLPKDNDTSSGMQFFAAQDLKNSVNNKVNWQPILDSPLHHATGSIVYNGDTLTIFSDSLQECNADRFLDYPYNYQTFTVTVNVSGTATITAATQLMAFAMYDNYKGIWPLGQIGSYANGVYIEQHVPKIPVHFAVYGLLNNHFYAGVTAATPVTGGKYTVTLVETDPAQFKAQLNNLTK